MLFSRNFLGVGGWLAGARIGGGGHRDAALIHKYPGQSWAVLDSPGQEVLGSPVQSRSSLASTGPTEQRKDLPPTL